jgi:hypothetical protein
LTGVAVKTTLLSWQTETADAAIETDVVGMGVTVIESVFEVTTGVSTQTASLVITQLITSPLFSVVVE